MNVCDTKVFYDTEFEAERAANIFGYRHRTEMLHYRCGTHWHIAHKDPQQRGKQPKRPKKDWCEVCKQPINRQRYWKHILTGSHLRLEAQQKEKT